MTQHELAVRLNVGQQAVSSWERGTSRPETEALIGRIVQVFPEHDTASLRIAGRYNAVLADGMSPIARGQRPIRPLLESLPFDQLSFQQFQGFCALLLRLLYESSATINQFGVEGDPQDGIDLEARFSTGRYETFQCKREKRFGPEKVRKAIKAQKVRCDRAVLLLSRRATAAARKALQKSKKWELWDAEDIARIIRTLPLAKQKRLVEAYFRAYRKDFLGIEESGAFETPEEHFAPLLHRDQVFSHAWHLEGRDQELARLLELSNRGPRELTLLVGRGGIGKSRLVCSLAEASRRKYPGRPVFILATGRAPSSGDYEVVAEQQSLLIIEDAHEHPQIGALLATIARLAPTSRVLVTMRPYAAQWVRGEAEHNGLRVDADSAVTLQPLTVDQAERVAREILADHKGPVQLARDVARLTQGSTLALVVGSYLVAEERIHPSTLNNSQQFRDQLFGRFRDALTGQIGVPSEHATIRQTLDLIALVQPIDPASPSLGVIAEQVLHIPIDRIKRAIQLLRDAGVLTGTASGLRIVPDLLAEFILEDACAANGGPSGYVERIMAHCDESLMANILLNVSKLDWRLSEGDEMRSRLADAVWRQAEIVSNAGSSRRSVAQAVARAAYYQPARALRFYDQLKGPGKSQSELVLLLKHAAMNFEHVEDAAQRLWEIGRHDERPLNPWPDHPLRALNELAAIEPGKPVEYCERIVRFAMREIVAGRGGAGEHSAFGILRTALATEGHTSEASGLSVQLTGFGIRQEEVAPLRQVVIDFLLRQLGASDLQTAFEAAGTLGAALQHPRGIVGRTVAKEETNAWSAEFVQTLGKIQTLVESATFDPFVLIQLQRAISWHAHRAGLPTQDKARAVFRAIPQTLLHRVSLAIMDAWGRLTRYDSENAQEARIAWQEELKRVASDLVSAYPDRGELLDVLRERLRTVRSIAGATSNPGILVRALVDGHMELAGLICEAVIANPNDPLREVFGDALYRVAMLEPERALVLAGAGIDLNDAAIGRQVSCAYSGRLRSADRIRPEERALAERLVRSDDSATAQAIIHGITGQAGADLAWTLSTLLSAPIQRSAEVAEEVFCWLTGPGDLPLDSVGEAAVLAFLDTLTMCPTIENYWIQEFLAAASFVAPAGVIRLLTQRIERDALDPTGEFQPMPYVWNVQLRFRDAVGYPGHLQTVREWLVSTPKNTATVFWGPKLYATVAGGYDQVVLADLRGWAKSGDPAKLEVVARILSAAPNSFVFEERPFVVELLEVAATVSKECSDRMCSALWASAIHGSRHGTPGQPFPEDKARRDCASDALAHISRSSPAWSFFDNLKRDAEADIRRTQEAYDGMVEA